MDRLDSFSTLRELDLDGQRFLYFSLPEAAEAGAGDIARWPVSLKVLFENLLRHEDGVAVTRADIEAFGTWRGETCPEREIAYHPSRIVMPDSSGVPLLADLAAMRDAIVEIGGDPGMINPLTKVEMVIDHSVIVDVAGRPDALARNLEIEYERNTERYTFLRWAQNAFSNVGIVPPGNGIIHQVNLEFLASVVETREENGGTYAFPDTVIGMDSHTPMINGIGVLGWGVGGIEAGAAMLGQPVTMNIPEVIGVRLTGTLAEGATSTDLVLTLTQALRRKGVVQKFVEFCGPGLSTLPLPTRATIANMAPEYGATVGFFPVDPETLAYLRVSGRPEAQVRLVEAYAKAQGMWRDDTTPEPDFTDMLHVDLSEIEPSMAGPRRPQDRLRLSEVSSTLDATLSKLVEPGQRGLRVPVAGKSFDLGHGDVVIAAVTSCTNTSAPSVMMGAGLLARNAGQRGLRVKPWVKTSFAPGSRVVADYLTRAGLRDALDALGYQIVGFGCTTCMGNSGPLDEAIGAAIDGADLAVGAVLSGNRNFEGRVHPQCKLNYLASPPLVIAYAIAGRLDVDFERDPLGEDRDGKPVYLRDIWPSQKEIEDLIRDCISSDLYKTRYATAFDGDESWRSLKISGGQTFAWDEGSDYIRRPPFFAGMTLESPAVEDIAGARALLIVGDSITTDHISPVGAIPKESAAGQYLLAGGIGERDFNSYAARRVNHDVMIRGTFANPRLKNELAPDTVGGTTRHMPDGEAMTVYDAAERYRADGVPLVVIGGADYGSGSSRDWAAKGTRLLGVSVVMAESVERIHRSNLIGMGVLPLQFRSGENRKTLLLDGTETYHFDDLDAHIGPGSDVPCRIVRVDGSEDKIELLCRLDTAYEVEYFRNGGILHFMLRRMVSH